MAGTLALLGCLASTLFMTGVVAFVQVVHYPLFDRVDPGAFARFHGDHVRRTTAVVVVPMVVELVTSVVLVVRPPARGVAGLAWVGLACALGSWAATGLLSVPRHDRLARGFDAAAHRSLVATNVVRLATWTAHAAALLVMTARCLA